jgi:hypothetical protein
MSMGAWYNAFRVTLKDSKSSSDASHLGDRTLSMWVGGPPAGNILHFPTYTYTNMVAAGNVNLVQNIAQENRHLEWFYVYFGYSKVNR